MATKYKTVQLTPATLASLKRLKREHKAGKAKIYQIVAAAVELFTGLHSTDQANRIADYTRTSK